MGELDMVSVPLCDVEAIVKSRLRWRAYALAWEVQRLGKTQDQPTDGATVAEVTSG